MPLSRHSPLKASRTVRLIQLSWLLASGRRLTIDDVCRRFHVHRRTAFRDLRALKEAGLNVVFFPQEATFRLVSVDEE
jgi:predicted DNA-binding transcriptional regulator YafY